MSEHETRDRFGLYRLCECAACDGRGKVERGFTERGGKFVVVGYDRCLECRGEGRVRQQVASCDTAEAVGVALVTCGREGEWEGCAFGLLDREGETNAKWLVLPWLPSPRNVSDAGRVLARSKRT